MNNRDVYGYGYDLWLYSVGAKLADYERLKIDMLRFKATEYNEHSFAFPVCEGSGVFLNFTSVYEEAGGTIFLKKSEKQDKSYFAPPWLNTEEANDVHYMKIEEDYKVPLLEAIRLAIEMSPVRKAYLQIRCQCRGRKNVIGMLDFEQIKKLVCEDKILGNIVYTIFDHPYSANDEFEFQFFNYN